jgi:hypothetical protein
MNEGSQQHEAAYNISRGHVLGGLLPSSKTLMKNQKPEDDLIKREDRGELLFEYSGEMDNSDDVFAFGLVYPVREIEARSHGHGASEISDARIVEKLRTIARYRSPSVETVTDDGMPWTYLASIG